MKNREKNFASAVIYVHNAEMQIERFLQVIIKVLEENFEHSEIICVNDYSDDNSLEKIRKISETAERTGIAVINMSCFHGLELSMNAGIDMSIGDFVFEFDNTNLNFPQNTIMDIYQHSLTGYDIVSAVPDIKERISSDLFYKVFHCFAHDTYKMNTESFRVLSRRAINRIASMNKMVPYRKAVYANCGLKTDHIKYKTTETERKFNDKTEKKYRARLAVDSLILFTEFGYRFSVTMTFIMMTVAVFMVVYSLATFFFANPVEGWTTTILFFSVAFLGVFGILTIIVKYLQLLVDLIFKRKYYSFESIEKLTR